MHVGIGLLDEVQASYPGWGRYSLRTGDGPPARVCFSQFVPGKGINCLLIYYVRAPHYITWEGSFAGLPPALIAQHRGKFTVVLWEGWCKFWSGKGRRVPRLHMAATAANRAVNKKLQLTDMTATNLPMQYTAERYSDKLI